MGCRRTIVSFQKASTSQSNARCQRGQVWVGIQLTGQFSVMPFGKTRSPDGHSCSIFWHEGRHQLRLAVEFRPRPSCTTIARRLLLIAFVCCLAGPPNWDTQVSASQQSHKAMAAPLPIWSVDLHPVGFGVDQQRPFEEQGSYALTRFTDHAVALTPKSQVAVVFETLTMKSRTGYAPGTSDVHLVVVDAASGKITAAKHWPGNEDPSVSATPSGKILYEGDSQLVLYTSSLEVVGSLPTEKMQNGQHVFLHYVNSADGQYVLLEDGDKAPYTETLIDAETLRPIRSWTSDFHVNAFFGGHFARWELDEDSQQRAFYVKADGAAWEKIYAGSGCREPNDSAEFATDQEIAIAFCNKIVLVDLRGNVIFAKEFSKKHELNDLRAAAHGKRVAISDAKLKRDPFWTGDPGYEEVHPTLIICDTQDGQAIWNLVLNPKHEQPFGYDYALSEDGSQLALLLHGVLEMYRMPAQ